MEEVGGQSAGILEDIRTFDKVNIRVRTGCNGVPQLLPVFFRTPLLFRFIERVSKVTMVWIYRDARDRP